MDRSEATSRPKAHEAELRRLEIQHRYLFGSTLQHRQEMCRKRTVWRTDPEDHAALCGLSHFFDDWETLDLGVGAGSGDKPTDRQCHLGLTGEPFATTVARGVRAGARFTRMGGRGSSIPAEPIPAPGSKPTARVW